MEYTKANNMTMKDRLLYLVYALAWCALLWSWFLAPTMPKPCEFEEGTDGYIEVCLGGTVNLTPEEEK